MFLLATSFVNIKPKTIYIQPLGDVNQEYISYLKKSVESFYGYNCVVKPKLNLTSDILAGSKTRYEAGKILKKYNNDLNLLIASEDYFLTLLDVWVFAQKYNVPIILFSSTNIINDIRIVQGETPSIENKEYLVDETAMNKNPEFNYAWIVLGGNEEDKFFFYLSSSKNKSAHDINKNEIIAEPLHKTQMGEFQQQLEYVFEQNKVFSVEDYLKRYML